MIIKPLRNTLFACLILVPVTAVAKAAECDGAITADEALKAEDARYAAQTKSDFDALERLYGDDLVYVHSSAVVDSKASYIDRQRSGLHYQAYGRATSKFASSVVLRSSPEGAITK
jgi:hypothetical protein